MIDKTNQLAEEYDRLEALRLAGVDPATVEDPVMADGLRITRWLASQAEPRAMPREHEFTRTVIRKVSHGRRRIWWQAGLALAASIVIGFMIFQSGPQPAATAVSIDQELLDQAMIRSAREDMLEYLESTERLLVAMRDYDIACSEDQTDMRSEKELAKSLLLRQKLILPQMNNPAFYQAKHLFNQLEGILVDVNSLDLCSDPFEVEFINEQINEQRILNKLRLIAQDMRFS